MITFILIRVGIPMQQTNDVKDRDRAQRDFYNSQIQNQNQNQNLNSNQNMGLNQLLNLNLNQNNGMQMSSTSTSSTSSSAPSPLITSNGGQVGGGSGGGQTLNQIPHNLTLGGAS